MPKLLLKKLFASNAATSFCNTVRTVQKNSLNVLLQGIADLRKKKFFPWQVGNSFNAYFTGTQDNKMIQETLNDNASAQVDKLFGFNANLDKIETEYSAVQAVGSPYDTILTFGLNANVDTTLKEYHDKVFAAGAQKVIDEVQKQVDAFLAAKK